MVKISKEPAPGINKEEREIKLAAVGYGLRKNKQTGGFYLIEKRQLKKGKKSNPPPS